MWNECRSDTLPALIARLVEAYECNPERSAAVMRFKYLPGKHREAQNPVNDVVAETLDQSESQATQETFDRTLHVGSLQQQRFSELLDRWRQGNEALLLDELNDDLALGDFPWMRTVLEKERFDDTPDKIERMMESPTLAEYLLAQSEKEKLEYQKEAEAMDRLPALKEEWAKRFGVDPKLPSDEFVRLCHLASLRQIEDRDLDSLRAPSSMVFWAKELVGRLAEIIEREDAITKHPIAAFGSKVPDGIRVLFEQAHLAYLFDFDIPCTLTCGALIEEAFQERFKEMFNGWDMQFKDAMRRFKESKGQERKPHGLAFWEKIDKVAQQNPFASAAKHLAIRIWDARSLAMHHPEEYFQQLNYKSKDALFDTRQVLTILFEQDKPMAHSPHANSSPC